MNGKKFVIWLVAVTLLIIVLIYISIQWFISANL